MSATAQVRKTHNWSPEPALLAAALETCPENLAIVEGGCVVYANRSFVEIFGYSVSAELQGVSLAQLIPASQILACGPHAAGSTRRIAGSALRGIRKDGTPLNLQMSCACFRSGEKELLILSLDERPGDELEIAHPEHFAQMEALGRLAAAVAHDFNNLLTGILLYCDLLVAGLETHNPLRAYVTEIRRAGGHSAELIQQLMAVARPQPAESGAHSWKEVILGMHNLLARLLGENIELQMDLPDEPESVAMDAVPMRQIILNLLLNARDAMPDGGRIAISVRACDGCPLSAGPGNKACVILAVADSGCGMDAATRAHVFHTFFTTKRGQGNGLGLSTVDRIVHEHGGTIQIESAPNQGTRVSIHLPSACEMPIRPSTQLQKSEMRGNSL